LKSSGGLMTYPTLVLAAVGLAIAYLRRQRTLLWLGLGAIAWALMVAVITQVAYGLPRYLLPGAMIACLLAGYGVVQVAEYVGRRFPLGTAGRRVPVTAALTTVVILAG